MISQVNLKADFRAEAALLLACSRVCLASENEGRIEVLLRQGIAWGDLLALARRHGVLPLLHRHLSMPSVPQTVREELRDHAFQTLRRNLFLSGVLLRLLPRLGDQDIVAIPFKGPTLAAAAYGDVGLREFGDLDLLVRPADLPRARDLLRADGFRPNLPLPGRETAYLDAIGQLPLLRDDGVLVELHTTVTPPAFGFPVEQEPLAERLEMVTVAGRPVATFGREDLLLILCAHGGKHLWASLGWICDVAELIRASPALDWGRVEEMANRLRARRLLRLGLLLAAWLLDAPLPAAVVRAAGGDAAVRSLAAGVVRGLFAAESSPGRLETLHFYLRARERLRDGARYGLSLALAPTVADWTTWPLAPPLTPLYYLLRPLRLACKHGRNLLGLGSK